MKRKRQSLLKEKNEIVNWRHRYLRDIRRIREDGKKIYYLDEAWVNAGHTVNKVWIDETVKHPQQAFLEGLSTGLKNPSGKGKRLIILHIGSDDGFVQGGLLMFESKQSGDYHADMNADLFEKWFKNILPHLQESAVIVMDNASYHNRRNDKAPTAASRKADIHDWLTRHNIPF